MKRFLFETSYFFAAIFGIVLSLNTLQKHFNNEPPHYRKQYIETVDSRSICNAIIIGNSQATHSAIPSVMNTTGMDYYNLALNASSPSFYINWLNNIFTINHPKADYWIVFASPGFMSGRGWRKFEQDSEFFPLDDFCRMLFFKNDLDKELLFSNRYPFLKYRGRIAESFNDNWGPYEFVVESYDRGYITLRRNDIFDFGNLKHYKKRISKEAEVTFTKLIDMLSTFGGEIILVIPPEYDLSFDQYASVKEFLLSLSRNRTIQLYDFNDPIYSIRLNQVGNFVDSVHMSQRGSILFSTVLKNALTPESAAESDCKND